MSTGDKLRMPLSLFVGLFAVPGWSAQIYECVAIGGALFYSEVPCFEHKAIARTRHTVPDGMPFLEQVALIHKQNEAARAATSGAESRDAAARAKAQECGLVDQEVTAINRKYATGDYVEINEVNRDQARHRQLNSRRASLGCALN